MRQCPARRSNIAPKIDGLSNRGQHIQSSDPPREINAAERQFPIAA